MVHVLISRSTCVGSMCLRSIVIWMNEWKNEQCVRLRFGINIAKTVIVVQIPICPVVTQTQFSTYCVYRLYGTQRDCIRNSWSAPNSLPAPHREIQPRHAYSFSVLLSCSRTLHIDFRSESASGLIFVVGDFATADIASAYLTDGHLTFARRCRSGRAFEVHHRRYDDRKWHSVSELQFSFLLVLRSAVCSARWCRGSVRSTSTWKACVRCCRSNSEIKLKWNTFPVRTCHVRRYKICL